MEIAVLGYGTVGSGVVEIIDKKETHHCAEDLQVTRILDLRDFPGDPHETMLTKRFEDILEDDKIGVVVEAMGGVHPAFDFTRRCLAAGKHVVTSNKELVATKGLELLALAEEKNVNYLFEASLGGGIPIIRPLSVCLAGNDILKINGILNGTTNFILTKMIQEGSSFAEALKIAQENGYAEADPTADVEGIDACRKISILSSLSFGFYVDPKEIVTEGISKITAADVAYAADADCVIKLIGTAEKLPDGKLQVQVSPALIQKTSLLSNIDGVYNGVAVTGSNVGDTLFYGQGAGKLPTAGACVADVIDCVNHHGHRRLIGWGPSKEDALSDVNTLPMTYYIRLPEKVAPESLQELGKVKLLHRPGEKEETAFLASSVSKTQVLSLLEEKQMAAPLAMIRMADC
ncbi:MAG TPA: homoserine dehydrogenase [Clostridiales bacterium]|nr:homoserine dehydrogenase [Clostridiales bacterium]